AKKLGVSQPTVTRRRARLEKRVIDGYTAVPNWEKIGFKLLAIILVKSKPVYATKDKYQAVRKRGFEWLMKQPNVIMGGACEGLGVNSFIISVHRSYGEYDEFLHDMRLQMGDLIDDVKTLMINLTARDRLKPLHLRYLAEAL
ncbi:MAG: Lrp/AsnC family transcriptional regulator, partial [Candidatus Bathyarchaeota archaeon]|nr:Lrp/AsnC family transcriptional regulator [Candidatus Bathyarchaeota archaeon]